LPLLASVRPDHRITIAASVDAAAIIVEKTLQDAAVRASGLKVPPPAPSTPPPRKPWEKKATHFAPTHLLDRGKIEEQLKGGANAWRQMLHDALKHVIKVVDFVPFNAEFASTEAQSEVKIKIVDFVEMLEILKEDSLSGFPNMGSLSLSLAHTHALVRSP
jgi:hypothetical protein